MDYFVMNLNADFFVGLDLLSLSLCPSLHYIYLNTLDITDTAKPISHYIVPIFLF